jgi:GrpB-like predicted nucleotidyltransferase (UPF0157 family)
MKVVIEPHNPEWVYKFRGIKAKLAEILQDIPIVSIEHVGSTSIPGLQGKPVIDVDIIIPPSSLSATRTALSDAGYTDCGELNVPGRYQFRQPGYGKWEAAHGSGNGEVRHNTYAMIEGCPALRNHLDVKRVLLEDQGLREEYGRVKAELAQKEYDRIGAYVMGKNEILWKILRRAGWTEEELEPVITTNSQLHNPQLDELNATRSH